MARTPEIFEVVKISVNQAIEMAKAVDSYSWSVRRTVLNWWDKGWLDTEETRKEVSKHVVYKLR